MKISELAKLCAEIDQNCLECKYAKECKKFDGVLEGISPAGIVEFVTQDKEI